MGGTCTGGPRGLWIWLWLLVAYCFLVSTYWYLPHTLQIQTMDPISEQKTTRKVPLASLSTQTQQAQTQNSEAFPTKKSTSATAETAADKSAILFSSDSQDVCTNPRLCVSKKITSKKEKQTCQLLPCNAHCNNSDTTLANSTKPAYHYGGGNRIVRPPNVRGNKPVITGTAKAHSGCIQSDDYGFIFVHILKSGGTSVKGFLTRTLCDGKIECPPEEYSSRFRVVDCSPAIRKNPSYLVWAFVRNPYSRYYSGYAMANAPNFRRTTPTPVEPFSLADFVLRTKPERNKLTSLHLSHFAPQSTFLFDRLGCPAFDFVGRLEHLEADLQRFLTEYVQPTPHDLLAALKEGVGTNEGTSFGAASKGANFSLPSAYSDWRVQQKVYEEMKADFDHFGFAYDEIPPR